MLLNSSLEPLNAMHLAEPESLSIFCGILDNQDDAGQQAAVTGIIQSICLQVASPVDFPARLQAWRAVSWLLPTSRDSNAPCMERIDPDKSRDTQCWAA